MKLKNTIRVRSTRLFIINYTEILLQHQTSQYAHLKYSFLLALKRTAYYSTEFKLNIFTKFPIFCFSKSTLDGTRHYTESLQYRYCNFLYYTAKYFLIALPPISTNLMHKVNLKILPFLVQKFCKYIYKNIISEMLRHHNRVHTYLEQLCLDTQCKV